MDEKELKVEGTEEKGGCCGGMSKGRCCGGKALAVIGLLAIGGIGGFFAGRCHTLCEVKGHAAVSAPATPAATPQK